MFRKILFLALMIGYSYQCPENYGDLELKGVQGTCLRIENGTDPPWLTIDCHHLSRGCCILTWCRDFAFCLKQSVDWQKECARRIYNRRLTNIIVDSIANGLSYRFDVQYCYENLWKRIYRVYTVIKIKPFNSSLQGNGAKPGAQGLSREDIFNSLNTIPQRFTEEMLNKSQQKQEKIEEVFLELMSLETSLLEYGQYNLNRTTSEFNMSSIHMDVLVRKTFYQNHSHHFRLEEPTGENFLIIPSENLDNGSVVLGVIYRDLHQLFIRNKPENSTLNNSREVNSIILAATIIPSPTRLKENITLKFKNMKNATNEKKCMFWNMADESSIGWSGEGCYVKSTDAHQTECTCNHLTHFAVLLDTSSGTETADISEKDEKNLEILTYVGLTLSVIGITLTIISYLTLTDMRGPLSQIRVSLVTSLGAGQIMFLAGIGATRNKGGCLTVAALMQYFLMAAFCWMLVEGIYLYLFVVKVYNVGDKLRMCHGISWGLPALIVAISLSIAARKDGIESFVADKYCWMSSANGLIWIFIVFIVLIEFFNILILGRVIKEMVIMQQEKDKHSEQIRLGVKACIVMIPLLGISWLFGLLAPSHKAFAYIFTILNSTQGFLIFLLHCVRNSEVRARLKRRIQAIFPAVDDGTSTKRTSVVPSEVNEDSTAIAAPRKIKVQPLRNGEKTKKVPSKTSV
ncbi:adhesion G-protein coupled receptor D1-like isoform X2 [Pocillopora verrucosa]|uniref:adhesion G-protein coupled receptor D1-like isoform X2 n=1 Tax=Pocillopora verrucosa TaxID=203993 RepID=UPI00333F76E0